MSAILQSQLGHFDFWACDELSRTGGSISAASGSTWRTSLRHTRSPETGCSSPLTPSPSSSWRPTSSQHVSSLNRCVETSQLGSFGGNYLSISHESARILEVGRA
jgi:hypothetical protein